MAKYKTKEEKLEYRARMKANRIARRPYDRKLTRGLLIIMLAFMGLVICLAMIVGMGNYWFIILLVFSLLAYSKGNRMMDEAADEENDRIRKANQ